MDNVEQVKKQAIEARKIFEKFLGECPNGGRDFRAAFHLRPTSSDDTTIVSTLATAPMRGLPGVSNSKLAAKLAELCKVLDESADEAQIDVLRKIGFSERGTKSQVEEDVQAALIRDLILRPEKYGGMVFVASEFALFGYGENSDKTRFPDVLAFKDGILYDIELKKERDTKVVMQVSGYVKHFSENLAMYADCLAKFPNGSIEAIIGVKGVALVPYNEKSRGLLESASESNDVELWYFDINGDGYRFSHFINRQ